jgi:hypothetical protein
MPGMSAPPPTVLPKAPLRFSAQGSLYAVATMQTILAALMFAIHFFVHPANASPESAAATDVEAIVTLGSAAIFFALAWFADRWEKPAAIAALAVYVIAVLGYLRLATHPFGTGMKLELGVSNIAILIVLVQTAINSRRVRWSRV